MKGGSNIVAYRDRSADYDFNPCVAFSIGDLCAYTCIYNTKHVVNTDKRGVYAYIAVHTYVYSCKFVFKKIYFYYFEFLFFCVFFFNFVVNNKILINTANAISNADTPLQCLFAFL